ncbi:MAG: hypothetical protein HOP19_15185 [Acidobacteria bacterium]|nr:hypothetical protein [Acidobacteriota bacterium]
MSDIKPSQLGGLSADTTLGRAAGIKQASLITPTATQSLAASGLTVGGGLLGTLAGGRSQVGQLLGGVGGTLLGGAAAASGIFGSGIAAALPAFFTNPVTAVIGAGLIATALILNLRAKRDITAYRPLILSEYALNVKDNKVLEGVREVGKQKFGKEYKKHRLETVRLDETKNILLAYAERTGQSGNNKLQGQALLDPNNPRNRFVVNPIGRLRGGLVPALSMAATLAVFPNAEMPAHRIAGGTVNAPVRGRDHVPALLDGGEFVVTTRRTRQVGERNLDALNEGRARIVRDDETPQPVRRLLGGVVPSVFDRNVRSVVSPVLNPNVARIVSPLSSLFLNNRRAPRPDERIAGLSVADVTQRVRLIADLRRAGSRGGTFGALFVRLASRLEREVEVTQPQRTDRFVVGSPLSPARRLTGGRINAATRGFDHVPLLADGGEFIINAARTARIGVRNLDALNAGRASVLPDHAAALPVRRLNGGFVAPRDRNAPRDDQRASFSASDFFRSSEGQNYLRSFSTVPTLPVNAPLSPTANNTTNELRHELRELRATTEKLQRAVSEMAAAAGSLNSLPVGEIVGRGLRANPDAATDAVATGLRRRSNGALAIQDELGRGR